MSITTNDLFIFAVGLLTLFSPATALAVYAAVTGHFPSSVRKQIALHMAARIAVVLLVTTWLGQYLLRLLGITVPALSMTGGLILILTAVPMILANHDHSEETADSKLRKSKDWRGLIVVPLIFPLSIGAGIVSLIIATASRFNSPVDLLAISAVCVVFSISIGVIQYYSGYITRHMGSGGMRVMRPVAGIVLTAIAFQLLAQGVRELLPGLAR